MAYTTIDKPTDYFNTVLYTGNAVDGSGTTQSVTGVGFQPDWVWIKSRSATKSHYFFDVVRGATKELNSNNTNDENTNTQGLQSFNSDGFTLGHEPEMNENNTAYVSWNWKAGTTSGISGSADITPNAYSFNQTSGFSVVTYNGTDVNGNTVLHGLGAVPHVIFVKRRVSDGYDWVVYHKDDVAGLYLNSTGNNNDSSSTNIWFHGQTPTSTQFHIGTDGRIGDNVSTGAFVAYCFAPKQGYSKFGSYTGNGNADGTFVYTGFKPAFIMTKNSVYTGNWVMKDNKRSGTSDLQNFGQMNPNQTENPSANLNNAENKASAFAVDILGNGFKMRGVDNAGSNWDGNKYIYMAFAEAPFVTSTGIPTTAR